MLLTLPNEIFCEILCYLDAPDLVSIKSLNINIPTYVYKFTHIRALKSSLELINSIDYSIKRSTSTRKCASSTVKYEVVYGWYMTFSYVRTDKVDTDITNKYSKIKGYNRYVYKGYRNDDEINHLPYIGTSTYSHQVYNINNTPMNIEATEGMITDDFIYERKLL